MSAPLPPETKPKRYFNYLKRCLSLSLKWDVQSALFIFFLLIIFLLFLEWRHFIPKSGGSIKFNPIAGAGFELTYETAKGHSEKVSVISVPAYRMATPTRIILHAGDRIEISASGVISTSSSFDWFNDSPKYTYTARRGQMSYSNVMEEITRGRFNRDSDPNWRDANGRRLSGLRDEDFASHSALQQAHDRWRLYPHGNYGLLLGCVLPHIAQNATNLELINAVLKARENNTIFPVGQEKIIQCLKEAGNKLRLQFPPSDPNADEPDDILIEGVEGQLVLLVNDVLVSKESLDDLTSHCSNKEEQITFEWPRSIFTNGNPFVSKLSSNDFNSFVHELWYWDNVGSFTVVIKSHDE
jgi:hypothetical protein